MRPNYTAHILLFLIATLLVLSLVRLSIIYDTSIVQSRCKTSLTKSSDMIQITKNILENEIKLRKKEPVITNQSECYAHAQHLGDEFSLTEKEANERLEKISDAAQLSQKYDNKLFGRFTFEKDSKNNFSSYGIKNYSLSAENKCKKPTFIKLSKSQQNSLQFFRGLEGQQLKGVSSNKKFSIAVKFEYNDEKNNPTITAIPKAIPDNSFDLEPTQINLNNVFASSCNQSIVTLYEHCSASPQFDMQHIAFNYLKNVQAVMAELFCKKSDALEWTHLATFVLNIDE